MRTLPLLAMCACNHIAVSAPPPAQATPNAARPSLTFAVPEETMEFRTSLRGITVGLVQTAIGKPGWIDGRRAIIARSRGKSDGVAALFGDIVWELQTTIDLDAGRPLVDREQAWIEVAGKHEHHDDDHTWRDSELDQDVHSVIGELRAWRSQRGEQLAATVRLGGGHFSVMVWNAGRDFLSAAQKPAIRYDGRVRGDLPFVIWISDDAARVPLAFRADSPLGTIAVELTDYQSAAN